MSLPLRTPLLLVLGGLLAVGARAGDPPPGAPGALPVAVLEARGLLRRHRSLAALEVLEASGAPSVSAPEAAWLFALIAPAHRGRAAALQRVAGLPAGSLRVALLALFDEQPDEARDELRLALRRSQDPWLQLALATVELRVGDNPAAAGTSSRARLSGNLFVAAEAAQVEARALGEQGQLGQAVERARWAGGLTPQDSRPLALEAELERRAGRLGEARAALVAALARDPGSQVYARRLADLLREEPERELDPGLLAALRALPAEPNPERLALDGLLAENAGRDLEALEHYRRALEGGAEPVPLEHRLARLLAGQGRYTEMVRLVRGALPPELPSSPENLLRAHWAALEEAVARAPDPSAPAGARLVLAQALVGVGALREARAVASGVALGADEALRGGQLVAELTAHLAFESALSAELEAGYREAAHKRRPASLEAFLARLAGLARQHLPPADAALFAAPARGLRSMPILGAWLDHGARTTSPIVGYFRRHGRFLVLGQRNDQPVEAVLLSLGFLAERLPISTRGQHHTHDVAVGYDRVVRAWLDAQGGGLAGACLPEALWLDADAALAAEHDARRALTRDPSLAASALSLPVPPADTREGPFALGDAAGVGLRLLARYAARDPQGRWGSFGTLRAHESGHVIDIRRHLPLWHGLPATLSLLASVGFAPKRMEAVLERRAQLASVIDAPDPDLALEEMIELLPVLAHEPEVHAAGYRDGLDLLVRHVWSRPDLYPEVDRTRRVLPQLDRLSNEQLRQAARAVAGG